VKLFSPLLATFILFFSQAALAFLTARAGARGALLLSEPSATSSVLERIAPSALLSLGDQPIQGFYRARSGSGKAGWIARSQLVAANARTASPEKGSQVTAAPAPLPQAAPKFDLAANLGLSSISGSSSYALGLSGDYRFTPRIAGGLYFSYSGFSSAAVSSATSAVTESLVIFAAEGNYFVKNTYDGLFLGAKLGIAEVAVEASGALAQSSSGTIPLSAGSLAFAPAVGYLYRLNGAKGFAVGAETNYFFFFSGGSNFNFLATGRYAF
jgi:hypothetical protein